MKIATCLTALYLCALSPAFAEEPQATAAAVAPAPTSEAKPAAAEPATTEAKAAKSEAEAKAAAEAEIKKMRARGYKPLTRNGQQLYCRSEGELGSRFERVRCNTMDELKQAELNGKDYVKSIQQQGSPTEFKGDMPGSPTH